MPNSPSAIKRLKQSKKRRLHNRVAKKLIKTYGKKAMAAVTEGDLTLAEKEYRSTVAKIDKAGARRVLHPEYRGAAQKQTGPRLPGGRCGGQGQGRRDPHRRFLTQSSTRTRTEAIRPKERTCPRTQKMRSTYWRNSALHLAPREANNVMALPKLFSRPICNRRRPMRRH